MEVIELEIEEIELPALELMSDEEFNHYDALIGELPWHA